MTAEAWSRFTRREKRWLLDGQLHRVFYYRLRANLRRVRSLENAREDWLILNGTGSGEPKGILNATGRVLSPGAIR